VARRSFFLPGAAERVLVEETQAVIGLEGAAGRVSLAQAEHVVPHLFLAEQIRRAVGMRSQPALSTTASESCVV
jgi:hypothetical protein